MIHKTTKPGFSLIELLVVIAIIAVFASILFPVFTTAKKTAQQTSCASNMKQLGAAFAAYRSDWGSTFPLGGMSWEGSDYSCEWQNATWKYVKKDALYRCSATRCPDIDQSNPGSYGTNLARPRTPVTYLYNRGLGTDQSDAFGAMTGHPKPHYETEVRVSSKCILLMEGFLGAQSVTSTGTDCHGKQNTLWLRDYTFYDKPCYRIAGDGRSSYGLPFHSGGNVLFVDGHIKTYRYNDAQTLQGVLPWMVHVPISSIYLANRDVNVEIWRKDGNLIGAIENTPRRSVANRQAVITKTQATR